MFLRASDLDGTLHTRAWKCAASVQVLRHQANMTNYDFDRYYSGLVHRLVPNLLREGFSEPGRNEPCPCGSQKKSKRCCFD